jgi:hypothetical protein
MNTENVTASAARDRWFALPYLIIGALGILPALYILGFMGIAVLDGRPLHIWFDALPRIVTFAAASSIFSAGMTLFVGYTKAIRARAWHRRVALWRATIAYNALLALTSIVVAGTSGLVACAWFIGLALLARIPLRLATADAAPTPA